MVCASVGVRRLFFRSGHRRFRRGNETLQSGDGTMKFLASLIACSISCLLVAGTAEAQQAEASSGVAPSHLASGPPHKGVKVSASKKAKTPGKKSAAAIPPPSHEELPCPRATWKDDPVCAGEPDEHTLPTPSSHATASPQRGAPKVQFRGWTTLRSVLIFRQTIIPACPAMTRFRCSIPCTKISLTGLCHPPVRAWGSEWI